MKIRSKIVLILTLIVCLSVLAAVVVGCKPSAADTHTVTYVYGNGSENVVRSVNDGDKATEPKDPARAGYKFDYWYSTDVNVAYDFDTAVTGDLTLTAHWTANASTVTHKVTFVYGNGSKNTVDTVNDGDKAIKPQDPVRTGYKFDYWYSTDVNAAYDFNAAVTSDLTLTAHWTSNQANLYWNAGQFADFLIDGESGDFQPSRASIGQQIMFKLRVYSDAIGTAIVKVNGQQITPDNDGWYVLEITAGEMRIAVEGLSKDNTPISGVGSLRDPYVLSTPAQFKRFIDGVNSPSNTRYNAAYVALGADLSFNGEELEPIGLELNSTHFAGTFDGRGHTLSNFAMKGKNGFGGLFGYVVTGEVMNVHVKDAVYNIDTSEISNYIVGGIVAYNIGSDIFGCSFDGTIQVDLDATNANAYVGGIVGFGQGYSDTNSATISYCTSNTEFISDGNAPLLTVGGIAGSVSGTADSAPLLIYNCIYSGKISGKVVLAGGITGYLRENTSIANCYTQGLFIINNRLGYAAAGAFVGLAEQNTAITNSYSTATYSAIHANVADEAMPGTRRGDFAGNYYPDGDKTDDGSVDSKEILILNSYIVRNGQLITGEYDQEPTIDFDSFAAVKQLLKWNDSEWRKTGDSLQVVVDKDQNYGISISVTVDFDGQTVTVDGQTIVGTDEGELSAYIPLDWLYQGNGQNTFKSAAKRISYGFYLDAEHTVRLPASMLITSDITLYVGFADYSEIASEYYVTSVSGKQAKLVFDDNGMLTMTYDGRIARYMYVYDGEKILIKDGYFAYMYVTLSSPEITDFYAIIEDNALVIYDNLFFTYNKPLYAYLGNAIMGDWYNSSNDVYTFYLDGTGLIVSPSTLEREFEYSISGHDVTIVIGEVTYKATLSQYGRRISIQGSDTLSLDKYDVFAGEWETDFSNPVSVTFDGMGTMTFGTEEFGYAVDADGVITFAKGRAEINENGLIDITFEGNEYSLCRAHSYRGTWYESSYDYTIVFEGIGVDGYGSARDSQGFNFTYSVTKDGEPTATGDGYNINLYLRMSLFGMANYYIANQQADGSPLDNNKPRPEFLFLAVYYQQTGAILDNFNLAYYDPFEGDWHDGDGVTYSFNGLGAYDINTFGDNMPWILEGEVVITDNGNEQTVRYYYFRDKREATFTYNDKKYVAKIDGVGNITFTIANGSNQNMYAPDMYANIILIGEGYTLSFNGMSASNHGVAVLTHGADEQTFDYVLNGIEITLLSNNVEAYTITLNEQTGFMVMSNGTTQITFGRYSSMGGNIYVAPNGALLTVGMFNVAGQAEGVLFGEEAIFVMQTQNQVAIYVNGELEYYLVQTNDVRNVGLYDAYGEFIAMLVMPDGIMGTFTAADGSSFEFDGRSNVVGYYANVTYTKDGEEIYYYYTVNDEGNYEIFTLDRNGEYDETTNVFIVRLTQCDGATEYVNQDGDSIWIVVAEAE